MANIGVSLRNISQLLLFQTTSFAKNHKKKLILAIVLVGLGYIAKKKLTMGHILTAFQTLTKIIDLLPLPQVPNLREIAQYQHPERFPVRAILSAINLEQLKRKLTAKEATWQQLKDSIVTGTILTLTLYNVHSLYFLIQCKYSRDFSDLHAQTQFQKAMYDIRKRFTQQIPSIFQTTKAILKDDLDRIQLLRVHQLEQLHDLFRRLTLKIFKQKYDNSKEEHFTSILKVQPTIKNRFTTHYEYIPQKSSIFKTIFTSFFNIIGTILSPTTCLPSVKMLVTTERYKLCKHSYIQPLKKADSYMELQKYVWPNKQSKELFSLVLEQMLFTLNSLNFSIVLKANAEYNLKILSNRLTLLMSKKQKESIKFSELLPLLYKIIEEQFLKQNQYESREKYHNNEVKKAFKITQIQPPEQSEVHILEDRKLSIEELVLQEIQLKKQFQFLEKEMELKLFNERSGVVIRPKRGEVQESQDMQRLLSLMGSAEGLNSQQ